ncbi:hypothetical protein C8Q72DRAFT_273766 [Fomitopsis betulina]|nr:hypothetical protein C8Q72DRAFT_273766 [Fomitopsis betulina]
MLMKIDGQSQSSQPARGQEERDMMPCPYRESACSRYTPSDFSIRDGGAAGGDRCARGTLNGAKVAGITMGSVFCSVPGRLCASSGRNSGPGLDGPAQQCMARNPCLATRDGHSSPASLMAWDAERRSSPGSRQTAGTRLRKRNRESYISIQGGPVYSNNASVPRFSMLGQWAAKLRGAFTRHHLPSMPAPTPPILRSTPLSQTGTTRVAFR